MKPPGRKRPIARARLLSVLCLFFLLALSISYRAYTLQGVGDQRLEDLAERQHERTVDIQGPRGSIFDRNGVQLAGSLKTQSVFVNPRLVQNPKKVAKKLAPITGVPESTLRKQLQSDRYFVWVKRQSSPKEYEKIKAAIPEGFGSITESRRFYPQRELAGHLLGFVGFEGKGLEGLELKYNSILEGQTRRIKIPKDARGRSIDLTVDQVKENDIGGKDIHLTIDQSLQHIVERELDKAVRESGAKGASAVMLDPQSGEILALANAPIYDPNLYSKALPETRKNRALVDVFEPGSVMKVFLIAKALERNLLKVDEKIFCENGKYLTQGKVIHDVKKHEWLTPEEIIQVSSNIAVYKISQRFRPADLFADFAAFGFGEKTGVSLLGESRGILPQPSEWKGVMQGNIGFGQGMAATTLQIARAYASIANGGRLLRPKIIKSISGENTERVEPEIIRRVLTPNLARTITRMMVAVTQDGGTGSLAAVPGFDVAGKTGTSQKPDPLTKGYSKDKFVSSFVGFVPADSPQLVLAIVIDEPQGESYGGMVAAPVFKRIVQQSLIQLGVVGNRGNGEKMALPKVENPSKSEVALRPVLVEQNALKPLANRKEQTDAEETHQVPDVSGLTIRQAMRVLNSLAIPVRISVRGSGIIYHQMPVPGETLDTRRKNEIVIFAKPARELSRANQKTI